MANKNFCNWLFIFISIPLIYISMAVQAGDGPPPPPPPPPPTKAPPKPKPIPTKPKPAPIPTITEAPKPTTTEVPPTAPGTISFPPEDWAKLPSGTELKLADGTTLKIPLAGDVLTRYENKPISDIVSITTPEKQTYGFPIDKMLEPSFVGWLRTYKIPNPFRKKGPAGPPKPTQTKAPPSKYVISQEAWEKIQKTPNIRVILVDGTEVPLPIADVGPYLTQEVKKIILPPVGTPPKGYDFDFPLSLQQKKIFEKWIKGEFGPKKPGKPPVPPRNEDRLLAQLEVELMTLSKAAGI